MVDVRAALRMVRSRCVHAPLVTVVAIVAVLATAVHEGVFHHALALDVAFRYGFSGLVLATAFAGRTLSTLDYGASAVTAGAGGALVAVLAMRRISWFAIFWVVVGLLAHHQIADWEHLVSFTTGYGLGRLLGAPAVDPARRAADRAPAHALAAAGLA